MSTIVIPSSEPGHPTHHGSAENIEGESSDIQCATTLHSAQPTVDFPRDKRGLALGILATVAIVFALEWAQGLAISLLLGVVFAYTLNPLVVWLERIRIPRVVGASVVMVAVVCAIVFGTYSLRGQIQTIITQLPSAVSKLSAGLTIMRNGQIDNMQKVQTAANDMEAATNPVASIPSGSDQRATHVVVDAPAFKLGNYILAGSMGFLGIFGQAAMVVFLVYFLLLAGDTFKRKLMRITGPSLSRKKITVYILDDINRSIQRYMFMLFMTNVLVALLTWLVFRWIGLENAGAWAVAAGLLHVIPYFGPGVTAMATGMAAFMQFDSLSMTLLVMGVSLSIATVVGTFVTTWMTGRIAKMNTAAVFISLLFWAWLWGPWGMLLSTPIMVIVNVVSHRVERLRPIAELLGE